MIRNPPPQAIAMSASKPPSRRWTSGEESQLREMLEAGRTADEIADALDRTPYSIYARIQRSYQKRPVRDIARAVGWRAK
jgi:hypothetical protein